MSLKEKLSEKYSGNFSAFFTMIIGLGFFTTAITWSVYNIYVPIFLDDIIPDIAAKKTIIGIIMILDNIAAITLQPWIGNISDNTWTKFGRRMPFLLVGIPLAAAFFGFIPMFQSLVLILIIIGGFNIAMAIYRAPVVALMPDLVPNQYRSRGNAIINLMGGIGSLLGLFGIPFIYRSNKILAFWIVSIMMVLSLIVLLFTIKESETPFSESNERVHIIQSVKAIYAEKDKSMLFILLAICAWFFGFNAVETWFSTYGVKILGITEDTASMVLGVFSLSFIIFAVPAGLIAKRFGRKNTIILGLIGVTLAMLPVVILAFIDITSLQAEVNLLGFQLTKQALFDAIFLFLGGMFWAFININSIVIVWELAGNEKLGTYTGIYYFFSSFAAIVSPVLAGGIFDLIHLINNEEGIKYLFVYTVLFFIIALICVLFVRKTGKEE
ncbi:MAG: MFS transporter [Candidatus Heimdallarchaeaceae archaeon]